MSPSTKSILAEMVQRLVSEFKPEKVILFGSHAYGTPDENSDIDLMVIMETDSPPHKRSTPLRKKLRGLGVPYDIVVKTPEEYQGFRDIIGTIIYTAAHKGKIVYERG